MRIGARTIATDQPPYVIAEIGVNHDGSAARAGDLIRAAALAGADAVKFQAFRAGLLMSSAARLAVYQQEAGAVDPIEMLSRLELGTPDLARLIETAHDCGMHAIVTIFSLELVDEVGALDWDAFKIASPDIINRPLIDAVGDLGHPLIISTGAADVMEVHRAIDWLEPGAPFALMQCVSSYPTSDHDAALGAIESMRDLTEAPIGYSDHTTSVDTGALAVCAGAWLLEKHLTHDRSAAGPDHAASLDPVQFGDYVRLARRAHRMLGDRTKRPLASERDVRCVSRQSVVSRRPIHAGDMIRRDDLTIKRPGTGVEPWRINDLIGGRAARTIAADMPLMPEDVHPVAEAAVLR
jgi:N,N'-diacetyllegionaminate synthase